MANLGKNRRIYKIFNQKSNRTILAPLDDALLVGPEGGLRNASKIVKQVVAGGADAIVGFPGLFRKCHNELRSTSGILNLTASSIRGVHTRKVLISSVEEALKIGLDGVAVHVNISSRYEPEMLKIIGDVSRECESLGVPLVGFMYPRTEGNGVDENYFDLRKADPLKYAELVRHAARIGVELGADLIKTQYTGNSESFNTVVESCAGVPVVIAGGRKIDAYKALEKAHDAILGGAAGVSFGRNVFNRTKPSKFIKALRLIVHDNKEIDEAFKFYSM